MGHSGVSEAELSVPGENKGVSCLHIYFLKRQTFLKQKFYGDSDQMLDSSWAHALTGELSQIHSFLYEPRVLSL